MAFEAAGALTGSGLEPSDPGGPFQGGAAASARLRSALALGFGRLPPTAVLLLAIISVQLGSALATQLFPRIGPIGTTFASSLFSAVMLTLAGRARGVAIGSGARLRRHYRLILLFGLVDTGMALPFFLALRTIPLGIASTITFLGPLGLAVATSRRPVHFLWIGVAAFGVAMLAPAIGGAGGVGVTGGLEPIGLAWAALAAFAWAAFVPLSKRTGLIFPGVEGLALALWVSAALLLPLAISEGVLFQGGLSHAGIGDLVAALGVSLLGVVLPMAFEFRALQRMSARSYGILVTLEPAAGALVGVICLGQPAGPRMLVAVGCVMLAALGVTLSERGAGD